MFVNEKMFGGMIFRRRWWTVCLLYFINLTKYYIAGRMYVKLQIGRVWLLDRYWKSWLSHLYPYEKWETLVDLWPYSKYNSQITAYTMNIRLLVTEWLWEKLCVFHIEEGFYGSKFTYFFVMRKDSPRNVFFYVIFVLADHCDCIVLQTEHITLKDIWYDI